MTLFDVRWENTENSSDCDTPSQAAHEALRTLHDAFPGSTAYPNIFIVHDRYEDVIHTIDLGDEDQSTKEAIWPRPRAVRIQPTLNLTDAQYLMSPNGFVRLLVRVDQKEYMECFTTQTSGPETLHWNLLHNKAFSFGEPNEMSDAQIRSVDRGDFLVDYVTYIKNYIDSQI